MAPVQSEEELIVRAAAGDAGAFEWLLHRHQPRVMAYVQKQLPQDVKRVVDAEDLVQETCHEAFRRLGQFQPDGPDAFRRWLLTIARHNVVDAVRAQRSLKRGGAHGPVLDERENRRESLDLLLADVAIHTHTPSSSAAGHEAAAALEHAIDQLPNDYRQAVLLRYFDGLSVAQTAERTGRSERAVHNLCRRALKELRTLLGRASRYLSGS